MTMVIGLVVVGFFLFMGSEARRHNRERAPREPLPRAQVREKP